MQALMQALIGLQKARETADYAFDQPVDAVKADQALANAEVTISEWQLLPHASGSSVSSLLFRLSHPCGFLTSSLVHCAFTALIWRACSVCWIRSALRLSSAG